MERNVSIPPRADFNEHYVIVSGHRRVVSIPPRADFNIQQGFGTIFI
jgi:hypothetical protein